MVVAISPDLLELKTQLEEYGHTVVILGEYNYPIDALIYSKLTPEISYVSANNMSDNNYGVLLVNAYNKSIQEINNILKNKVYSPLF